MRGELSPQIGLHQLSNFGDGSILAEEVD